MGTFYRSSDPDGPPLVEEGQAVAAGEVVCIIESMKIFTEIKAEKAGTVKSILLENEDMVMKDQAVIEIEIG
jgi:acetyl-CoA carboxylase biotin carboxyl carrier protein